MREVYLQDLISKFEKWFYQPNRFGILKNDDRITLNVINYTDDVLFNVHIPFECINFFTHSTIQRFQTKRSTFLLTTWIVNIPRRFIELNFHVYNCKVLTTFGSVKYDCVDDLPL